MNMSACLLTLSLGAGILCGQEPLERELFDQLFKRLTPKPDAPWRTIGWHIDLLEAQRVAAAESKPLFIWAMDGHPLGCT
jgi:hypothetical protein